MPRPWSRRTLGPAAAILALISCALPAGLPFAPTPTPTLTLTPTATSTPTPTPTPAPAPHFEAADLALSNGDWEQALSEYQAALVLSSDESDQATAQLGIGKTLYRSGDVAGAIEALTLVIDLFPADERRAGALLLRAQARRDAGAIDLAIADFDEYLSIRPGVLDAFVNEQVGDLLADTGRHLEAIPRYTAAASASRLDGPLTPQIKIGVAYLEGDDPASALAQFEQIYQANFEDSVRAAMNRLAGLALEDLGDYDAAYSRYLDNLVNYPDEYETYLSLVRLVEALVPVDDYLRGYIDYRAGAYEPALIALDRAASTAPTASVYYFRGQSLRALGNYFGAAADFEQVIASYPYDPLWTDAWFQLALTEWAYLDSPLDAIDTYLGFVEAAPLSPSAPDALFSAARTAERLGDLPGAAAAWMRIVTDYPASDLADRGAFESGVVRFRLAELDEALAAFELAEIHADDSHERAAALLWIGKCRMAAGDSGGAVSAWQQAAAADPTGYYSARAEDLLNNLAPFTTSFTPDLAPDLDAERAEAEAWLRSALGVTGPDPLAVLSPELASDPRMIRATEFWRAGMHSEARAELASLQDEVESSPEKTYRLMHALLAFRYYNPAIFAARQILDLAGMDDAGTMAAPIYFNRIRFGVYFDDLLLPEAERNGLDPLLLLAVVRQESLFDGFATSSAAARGLMQVIPETGQHLAGQIGWPLDFTEDDLYRPIVSLRFGSFYLASQRDAFGGDLYAALAAYNAGPGNSIIWDEIAPDDPDLFLEVVRFQETYLYLTRVYEFYAIYRRLYASP